MPAVLLRRERVVPLVAGVAGTVAVLAVLAGTERQRPPAEVWDGNHLRVLHRPLEDPRSDGWSVRDVTAYEGSMIVEVETERLGDAFAIARQIIDPVNIRYREVLVYFFRPGIAPRLASLRVQWTPSGGYHALWLERRRQP
jgi:hypothetical protein